MATIAENLLAIDNEKALQKSALEKQGQDMTNVPYTQYHEKILAIQSGGGGTNLVRCAAKIVEVDGVNELQIDTEDLTNGEMFLLGDMTGENDSNLQNLYLVNF